MDVKELGKDTEVLDITPEPVRKLSRTKKSRRKLIRRLVILAIVILAVVAIALRFIDSRRAAIVDPATLYTYGVAELRDISSSLAGSGTLQPADSYTVSTLVSGDILQASFEEGDVVSKGDVLYEIDSSDASRSIERAESSLETSRKNYNKKLESLADLTVTAPISGVITGINIAVGDSVGTQNAIAAIEDISTLTITEYYSEEYRSSIYVGMAATVSVPGQMLNLSGSVTEISGLTRMSDTGISCFAVTVGVSNPGSLTSGTSATASLGTIYPSISDDDGLDALDRKIVYAGVSGEVAQLNARNFEKVTAGQTLVLLTSDTLEDEIDNAYTSFRDAELSLQSQYDTLDNYTITAPIDGTIIEKFYKEGETSEGGKTLCIIYDLSSLSLTMNVDELDISTVAVGQRAEITTDSVEGVVYEGIVTRVGVNGTTSGGVTTYPVTIKIKETDGLLPGMNVDVTILVEESSNTLSIPAAAVARGGRVLVKSTDGITDESSPVEGYSYVTVKTGLSDGDYVEILSGLSVGDEIAYIDDIVTSDFDMGYFFSRNDMNGGEMVQMRPGSSMGTSTTVRVEGGF